MTAKNINGNELAAQIQNQVAAQVSELKTKGIEPKLAIILVGENPASQVYVKSKVSDSHKTGLTAQLETYPAQMSQEELLARIKELNQDKTVHGILVQLPLPAHMSDAAIIEAIAPEKDVDGFHISSAGALMTGQEGYKPCTPYGCMKMLESIGMSDLSGKHAVVIGRSNIVGKPMAMMLLAANATVTICHSKTPNLAEITKQADIIIAAVGRVGLLTGEMIKEGAVIIDVGMNRNKEGKLCGDVDYESAKQKASYITPVPGGVGPMTRAMLLVNTLQAANQAANQNPK